MNTYTIYFEGNLIIEAETEEDALQDMHDMLSEVATDYTVTDIA